MSISQNFPEEGPTLNLNFAGSKTLDPRITFSRTTTATYMDDSGLIVTASADAPRFDHRYVNGEIESLGLLVEESRSNLITYSEDFRDLDTNDTWEHFAVDVVQNSTTSPDGTLNATKLINTSGTSGRRVSSPRITVVSGTTYTHSVWLKAGEYTTATVFCNTTATTSNFNNLGARINLLTGQILGTVTNPISVIPYPNGWWKVSSTFTTDENTTTIGLLSIVPNTDAGGVNSVVGDGVSGIYVWGAQVEVGAFSTSYIPTSGGTVTRNPDNVTMTGDNFSDWYNQSEGTIYVSQKLKSIDTVDRNNMVYLINGGSGNELFYNVQEGNTNIFVFGDGGTNYSRWQENGDATDTKTIWAYDVSGDDFKPYWNGIEGVNESTTNTPSATSHNQLELGATAGAKYNGHISQLIYYPTRLTNAQLQTLTK